MSVADPIVFVVDDDASVREGLERLLRSVGLDARCHPSAEEFLRFPRPDRPSCILLDVRMTGLSGIALQDELRKANDPIPIIFLTGHGDVPMAVQALKNGAHDFILKPFREQQLLDTLRLVLDKDVERRAVGAELQSLFESYDTLSSRQREIVSFAVDGLLNKEIAQRLGLQEITVKVNRAKAMRKLNVATFADLCAKILKIRNARSSKQACRQFEDVRPRG